MANVSLSFHSDANDRFVPYFCQLLRELWDIDIRPVDHQSQLDIYHGNDIGRAATLRIPWIEAYDIETIPRTRDELTRVISPTRRNELPFDVFSASRFWLTDEPHRSIAADHLDSHERLLVERSAQYRLGLQATPIVNAYMILFRDILARLFDITVTSHLPHGAKAVVLLSHDVDNPINPGDPSHHAWAFRRSVEQKRWRTSMRLAVSTALRAAKWPLLRGQRHWLFDEICREERQRGFRSTFFFPVRSRYDDSAHPRFDVDYLISDPRMRRPIELMRSGGWEIGLHSSYNSNVSGDMMRSERETLEALIDSRVKGNRHHYWHLGHPFWPTLLAHSDSGFTWDTSIAFNDRPGFRLGIALPFRPWDPLSVSACDTVQIPTMIMDGSYFYHPGQTVGATVEHFRQMLGELKCFEGVSAIDWHQWTSYPGSKKKRLWGEAYLAMLDVLASDSEVAVLPIGAYVETLKKMAVRGIDVQAGPS